MMISRKFLVAIKLHPEPAYRLAQRAGVNPVVLSKLMNGIIPTKNGDPRITKVGKINKSKLREIAEKKLDDLNTKNLDSATKILEGTAKSMGIEIID